MDLSEEYTCGALEGIAAYRDYMGMRYMDDIRRVADFNVVLCIGCIS